VTSKIAALALAVFVVVACGGPRDIQPETDTVQHNPFEPFNRRPELPRDRAPIVVTPVEPKISQGSVYEFLDPGRQAIARRSFDKPRSMIAYGFWDPYQNNPSASALTSTCLSDGTTLFQVLGRLVLGNQGGSIAYNFDLPWGQPIAIPCGADSIELEARLISPPIFSTATGTLNFTQFNDPPPLVLGANTLPNGGVVKVTGIIGDGSPFPNHTPPAQRTAVVTFVAADGPGTSFVVPLAWGARRVTILGDASAAVAFRLNSHLGNVVIAPNTPIELSTTAIGVQLTTTGAIAVTTNFHVIYDLEL
jgi:hypothetical protein